MDYFQIEQLRCDLQERDKVIYKLSANLQAASASREALQTEYTAQAEQLATQICTLQDQLQQVYIGI